MLDLIAGGRTRGVFKTGNRADGFYIVVEGAVELAIPATGEQKDIIRSIGAKGHFGDRVLLGEDLRTGTVRALEDTVVLVVGAVDFQRIVAAMPILEEYFEDYLSSAYGIAKALVRPRSAKLKSAVCRDRGA